MKQTILTVLIFMVSIYSYGQSFGNSVYLDGINDYITIPDNSNLNQDSTISIEAWINPCIVSSDHVILSKYWCAGSQNAYVLYVRYGKLRWGWDIDGCGNGLSIYESNLAIIQINQWQHVAAVHTTNGITLFYNGVPVTGSLISGSFGAIQTSNEPLRIGGYKELIGLVTRKFTGQIDELRIWNYNLSSTEMLLRYNSTLVGNEAGLVAYYDMDITASGSGVNLINKATNTGSPLNGTTVGTNTTPIFSPNNACSTVGIIENSTISIINILPNPNNGSFQISYTPAQENLNLTVYNILGKQVYEKILPQHSQIQNINIADLSSGLYFVQLSGSSSKIINKFIIE